MLPKSQFAPRLLKWYAQNGRTLPWRNISDPYRIWISEIILQQTQVKQGYDYYLRFIETFPTVFELAKADEDTVMRLWQGLGYYSRARNLHAAAKTIATAGVFPTTYEGVRALKGVGDYTAAAICSFAYGLPHAAVDGNVYRVLSRVFGISTPIDTTQGKREFSALANELLDPENPGNYNQALMDFGALQCTPTSPDCASCPFLEECVAQEQEIIEVLPFKSKRTKVTDRYFTYFYLHTATHLFLHRRPAGDIWQGLYEPFLIETKAPLSLDAALQFLPKHLQKGTVRLVAQDLKHLLTHRRLHADCYAIALPDGTPPPDGYMAVPLNERDEYAVPALVMRLYQSLQAPKLAL